MHIAVHSCDVIAKLEVSIAKQTFTITDIISLLINDGCIEHRIKSWGHQAFLFPSAVVIVGDVPHVQIYIIIQGKFHIFDWV